MECPLTPIFPAHERYPLPVHGYFFAVGFFFLFTVISSILTCKLFQARALVAKRLERTILIASALATTFFIILMGVIISSRPVTIRRHIPSDRPRVIVMFPKRKEIHPRIDELAQSALNALRDGNPNLDLSLFIFDEHVPKIASDGRPLSKTVRIRNIMMSRIQMAKEFDYVMWIDSDLVAYPPDLPSKLIRSNPHGVTAPLVLLEEPGPLGTDQFYDTTAFVLKCTVNPSDPSPYLEGRNVDRLYPYVQRGDTTCTRELTNVSSLERCSNYILNDVESMDGVGTIYIVSADIYSEGMVLYEDHPAFTEHFSIAAHARRMGRPVLMYTRAVARHANLLLYGETFHDNSNAAKHSKSFKHDVPLELSDRWTKRVSLAYCDKLGRLPDEDGLMHNMELFYAGWISKTFEYENKVENQIRQVLETSTEGILKSNKWKTEQGEISVGIVGEPLLHQLFSVQVDCLSSLCMAFRDNWWERPCIVIPTSKECSANSRGKRTGLIHPLLELELQMTATTMLQQSSAIGWVGANSHLLGSTQAIVYKSARDNISFYGANMTDLAIDKPGIYRFRAWFKYESQLVEGYSQTFLVGSGMQHLISRQLWNTDQCQCLEDECVIVFSHSRQHSPTSEVQLLDSLQQAKERYGPSWQIHVYLDESSSITTKQEIENLGGKVLAADQLQGHGEMTWAFWPFLAFEGGAKKKRRIIVREAGHDVVQREVDAVKQWIISAKALHTMRDSLLHSRPFNSRLWGCIAPCEIRGRPLVEVVKGFLLKHHADVRTDEWFGSTVMLPYFSSIGEKVTHDSLFCMDWQDSLPFPTERKGIEFAGQPSLSWYSGDEELAMKMQRGEWLCSSSPYRCRGHSSWRRG